MKELFLLIDGNSLINRAFYALPPLNAADGTPTNAVYGFCTMLIKAITDYKPTHIAVAFDRPEPTFRHFEYKEYKATRKGMPDELAAQMPVLKQLLKTIGIKTVEKAGYEADDIIGTLADCRRQTVIVTGDRDSFQLIDACTKVLYTKRGISEVAVYDIEEFLNEYGFTPEKIVDYKALLGDASDNIPGVTGVGAKTAAQLICDYGGLDGVYGNLDKIKPATKDKLEAGKASAYLSKNLAQIDRKVPLDLTDAECSFNMPFPYTVRDEFIRLNMGSLARRGELFGAEVKQAAECAQRIEVKKLDQIIISDSFSIILDENIYISAKDIQYEIKIARDLLGGLEGGFDYHAVLNHLKPYLENAAIKKITFDAKFLMKKLKPWGISLNNYFDVKLAQYLIDVNVKIENIDEFCLQFGYKKEDAAYGLFKEGLVFAEKLKELKMKALYYDLELPLCGVLFRMENAGFRLDMALNTELGRDFEERAKKIAGEIYKACDAEFNVNSPKQLGTVLFDKLKIPYPKKSKDYSTAAEILEPLRDEYPVVAKVLDYRRITKLNNTYIEGFKKLADSDGVIHTEFKQALTLTGRLSSVEPNLQNIPIREEEGKRLRALFIAGENKTLIAADYSQIELRLLAHFSCDPVMCGVFNSGGDIHAQTAAEVYGVPLDMVSKEMRQSAKAVNFGIIYGISDFGLASNLRVPVKRAKQLIDLYFMRFAGVKRYLDECVELARQKGYAETLLGRIRKIPELNSSNRQIQKFGERIAMNMPLQGSAADIIKAAMIKADTEIEGTSARLILQVHDELIVESPDNEVERVKGILKAAMESAVKLNVPLIADVSSGKRWIDCK